MGPRWTAQSRLRLVGAGMFGGDVHARAYADLQRAGISPQLGRVGLDHWARDLAPDQVPTGRGRRTHREVRPPRPGELQALDRPRAQGIRRPEAVAGDPARVSRPRCHGRGHAGPAARGGDSRRAQGRAFTSSPRSRCAWTSRRPTRSSSWRATKNRIVAVDMHKRYDPDHLRIRDEIKQRIGAPLYGTAYLEEPLHVSTSTFKWVGAERPVQLRRLALGGFDLPLLPAASRSRSPPSARRSGSCATASTPTTPCRCGWISRTG